MKKYICFLTTLVVLFIPLFTFGDGGMVYWPPDVYLDQSAQSAVVAWNGQEEIIILSNDIQSDAKSTILRMIPLPSNPSKIKEGSFETFEKLITIMNEKLEAIRQKEGFGKKTGAPTAGIEITFQQEIGAHDVTVVKVNNLDDFLNWIKSFAQGKGLVVKEISQEFREGIESYLKRDIKYFIFDVINAGEEKESIQPLIYKFDSNYIFYPLIITGVSEVAESQARVQVFLITNDEVEEIYWRGFGYPVELALKELEEVSEDIADLFDSNVRVRNFNYYGRFENIETDLMIYPQIWTKNLARGNQGEDVMALQKILINEGVWDSEVEATGYFGPITESALGRFQEERKWEIFEASEVPESGYFGTKTREHFQKLSIEIEQVEEIKWERNLNIGMAGDDVSALQKILISEGVWGRPDIETTGYFGPITKQAVVAFQEKYAQEILEPIGLENGTGFVGPLTRSYLEKLQLIEKPEEGEKENYYGSSTFWPCQIDTDCLTSGCNGEICQGKSEETLYSICIVPTDPTPGQLGYSCGCVENKCQWAK